MWRKAGDWIGVALLGVSFAVPALATPCPGNPKALGVSRVVEIDTISGPKAVLNPFDPLFDG